MSEFIWNVTSKIKHKQLGSIVHMVRAKFPGENRVALGKGFLLALVGDLNERALTLLEKDLDVVGHKSKEEPKNRLRDSRIK